VGVTHVEWIFRPEVDRPVMICAFAGWNDGGEAASTVVGHLKDQWGAQRFAGLDPEEFYDFQVHRPTVRSLDGITRRIDWPSNDFSLAQPDGRDVLLFLGVEPNTRWRTYCESILRVASELDTEVLVTLGAFLADVPHTIPAPVNASSSDPDWLERTEIVPARYEGPTGIVGVLHDAAARVGLASVSVWAAAPHYLPAGVNPRAALALLEVVRDLFGLAVDTGDMARAAAEWRHQVDEAMGEDGNLRDYVRRLEEAAAERGEAGPLPSADDLAAEVERFLRGSDEA
jgi:proteasome assembly chaperone (PAC2) family protein